MKSLAIVALALSVGLASTPFDAEAKRLGGNRATGMQRSMPANNAPSTPASPAAAPGSQAAAPAAASTAAASTAAAAQKRSWMGPLAGLAAGLGLAALASYLGFGEGLANIMLIALVAMVGFFILRRFMGKRQGPQPAMAGAASSQMPHSDETAAPMMRQSQEPTSAAPAAGSKDRQGMTTLRLYCTVAKAVPQIEALLLVPNKVAGAAPGKVANKAGSKIRPPPPTIESINPASSEASETISNSMPMIVASGVEPACPAWAGVGTKKSAACATLWESSPRRGVG